MSLAGSALIFPGPDSIDWGAPFVEKPPFVSGLGPVWTAWLVMPLVSILCAAILMLSFRGILRAEDSFHHAEWVRFWTDACPPILACFIRSLRC